MLCSSQGYHRNRARPGYEFVFCGSGYITYHTLNPNNTNPLTVATASAPNYPHGVRMVTTDGKHRRLMHDNTLKEFSEFKSSFQGI